MVNPATELFDDNPWNRIPDSRQCVPHDNMLSNNIAVNVWLEELLRV